MVPTDRDLCMNAGSVAEGQVSGNVSALVVLCLLSESHLTGFWLCEGKKCRNTNCQLVSDTNLVFY